MPSVLRNFAGTFSSTATSQRLMKTDATEADVRVQPGRDAAFDAAQIRIRGGKVMLARKQQCHVDRHAGKCRLFDRRQAFGVPGILMNRFCRPARACSCLATAMVVFVSYASSGDTSSDTQPSTPLVRS